MHYWPAQQPPLCTSHWMREAADTRVCPPLLGQVQADVVILGGGFVGLWTALAIKEAQPERVVRILERHHCGAGASGRNGGFVMSWWPKIGSLKALAGEQQALFLARAAEAAIGEIADFCRQESIAADFRRSGWLWTATAPAHLESWRGTLQACAELGVAPFQALPEQDVARRTGSAQHLAGVFEASNATVQPGKLVAGLKAAALRRGVIIHENTAVLGFTQTRPCTVQTAQGQVQTDSLVIATNAWSSALPELAPLITSVSSTIVVTAPIPERLQAMGWHGGESITDSQLMVNYYRTSHDGRIAFGKGTALPAYGSRIGAQFSHDAQCNAWVESEFRRTYPALHDVPIEHAWSGPIDRTYDSLPVFGTLGPGGNIHYGIGWSGNGVGPSRVGGKILASLALGRQDTWSQCALVNRTARKFPPEPIRHLGARMVRAAVMRKEKAEISNRAPSAIDVAISKLAPSGLEDKS